MISVILPTTNSSKGVVRSLESILQQTYQDFKIFFINNNEYASEEWMQTASILEHNYKDLNNKLVYIDLRKCIPDAEAINAGIALAMTQENCEYISILRDRDYYLPEYLEKCKKALDSKIEDNEPTCAIAFANVLKTTNGAPDYRSEIPIEYIQPELNNAMFQTLFKHPNMFGTVSNIFIRCGAFKKTGNFDPLLSEGFDFGFLLHYFALGLSAIHIKEMLLVSTESSDMDYEEAKDLRYSLLKRFDKIIDINGNKQRKSIYIAQHRSLYELACKQRNQKGVIEQKEALKNWHYHLSIKERAMTKILTGDTDNFVRDSLRTIHSKDFADKIKVLEELSYYKYPFIKQKDLEKTPIPEEWQVAEEAKLTEEDIKTAELEFRDIGSDSSEDDSEDTIEEQPLD